MSYRSLKRVFGETKLELKLLFLFGVGLLSVIAASFWWYGKQTEKMVYEQNRNTGRLLVDHVMLAKHWRGLETASLGTGQDRSRPIADFGPVVDSLTKNLTNQKYTWDFIRPDVDHGAGAPRDEFEWEVREKFRKTKPGPTGQPVQSGESDNIEFAERLLPDADEYQYFQPVRAQESCLLVCHRPPLGGAGIDVMGSGVSLAGGHFTGASLPQSEGDLMAILKVTIPNEPTERKLDWNRAILWATAILTVFLAMVTSYAIIRYVIVKPLRHLRDVSDSISRGNITLRAEIHTGDEFEELALAFNRMLRGLVTIQEELRQANVSLDSKVDELAQANMRLYEMNTIKSDFLATMSHELRTPLNSILGFSDVLGSIDALDDKQKRYVQNIQKSGRTLLDMINDILDLAKMESGRMDIRPTEFRIAQVAGAQCDMARPLTEKKNIDLEMTIPPDLPPMRQDQARVQQIINNLLSNAIKFTPEGGRIAVGVARDEEDRLIVQVSDTGVGIAEEDQQVIFDKFRQGRVGVPSGDAMTREYSGSGLGLSIVKELCKLLGGEVSVRSELGKGSTFAVRLPWTLRESSAAPVVEGLDNFGRSRLDLIRDRASEAVS